MFAGEIVEYLKDFFRVSGLYALLIIPIIGIFLISSIDCFNTSPVLASGANLSTKENIASLDNKVNSYKKIALITTILNLIVSLVIYMLFDFSNNQFQFVQENLDLSFYDIYLGVDGLSIYFVLLTTIIMPIALISN